MLTLWRLQAALFAIPIGILLAILAVIFGSLSSSWVAGVALFVAEIAALGLGVVRIPKIIYRRWAYSVGEDAIEISHGLLFLQRTTIPYFRIQQIDITSGPLERRLGLRDLIIHTASAGSGGKIPGIAEDTASSLRHQLLERTGDGDAV